LKGQSAGYCLADPWIWILGDNSFPVDVEVEMPAEDKTEMKTRHYSMCNLGEEIESFVGMKL
jgi:hypothetical protein